MRREQDRRAAIAQAQIELNKKPVYLDTETTGLKDHDQIVEICLLDHDGSIAFESLVKPTVNIPLDATRVHHITDALVSAAPAWPEIWPQVETLLAERRIAIYNAEYDLRLLKQSHRVHGLVWSTPLSYFCIMKLYAQFRGDWNSRAGNYRWHSLDDARWQCGLNLPNAHRAHADTLLARAVLHHVAAQR
ncbi:MAG: 3'-5' exonuclease [Chloroflexi bacterium]|nr:3'-5' exonuclease [Chloroflexota bacterium]